MKYDFDIDIDMADRHQLLEKIPHIVASIARGDKVETHNTGVYLQDIPADPLSGMSNVDHKTAQELGYFKIDFLNVSIYDDIESEEELIELMEMEPLWELLEYNEVVEQLFHISKYVWLMEKYKPKSIEDLAMLLAVIRPSKRHLSNYNWDKIRREVWIKPTDGTYHFKKSHAISYAMAVVVQLNKLTKEMGD